MILEFETENFEDCLELVPLKYLAKISNGLGFVVKATDEESKAVAAAAVFYYTTVDARAEAEKMEVSLDYIAVAEPYRDRGLSCELLDFAGDILKEDGVEVLTSTVVLDGSDDAENRMGYLECQGFEPDRHAGSGVMTYTMEQLLGSPVIEKTLGRTLPGVCGFDKLGENVLWYLRKQKGLPQAREWWKNAFNQEFSKFYVHDGKIGGCFLIHQDAQQNLHAFCTFLCPGTALAPAFPMMLVECIRAAEKAVPADAKFMLSVHNPAVRKGMLAGVGEPESERFDQIYSREL